MPSYETVGKKIDQVEAEMKRIRIWSPNPIEPEKLNCKKAFCMDKLRAVASVHTGPEGTLDHRGKGGVAGKQFGRHDRSAPLRRFEEAGELVTMLYEFDRLFD